MIVRGLPNTGWVMGARGVNAVLSLVYLALAPARRAWRISASSSLR